jgi:LCP family protein required for cell wall assembly
MTEDDDRAARARQLARRLGQPGQASRAGQPGQASRAGQAGRPALPGDAARARSGTRGPDPRVAQQRLARQIALSRKARRQRITLALVGAMSAITLLVSGSAWVLTGYVSSLITRINAGTSGTPTSGPVNILVAGIDTRGGLTRQQELRLHVGSAIGANSDTLMLVHIPANHQTAQVVSLPRDSWVNIPGHGMSKINAAFGYGGPQLMVQTVEQATGLTINDYVEVDFLGFIKVIDALGGVNICVPFAVDDSDSGLHLSAGRHYVNGITALEFARDRHSFATSDLARITDQQQLLSSVFAKATQTGVLADPVRLERFVSALAGAVKVDAGFNLVGLADEMRGLRLADVSFTTVPLATASYITPTGQDAVLWDAKAAAALFSWVKNDTGTASPAASKPPSTSRATISRAQVSVDVYNGTLLPGLSTATGTDLRSAGFSVHRAGLNWPAHNVGQTLIEYSSGHAAQAQVLAQALPGAAVRMVAGLARIQLVLGTTGHTVVAAAPPAAQPSPAGAPGSRTAAQDACR